MKIIIVEKTTGKGGWQARQFKTENPAVQTFAKTPKEALILLAEKMYGTKEGKRQTPDREFGSRPQ